MQPDFSTIQNVRSRDPQGIRSRDSSQEKKFNFSNVGTSQDGSSVKMSADKRELFNQDYNFAISNQQVPRLPFQQVQPNSSQTKIGTLPSATGPRPLKIQSGIVGHPEELKQYQSIPVTRTKRETNAHSLQIKSFHKQNQMLKMYGSVSGVGNRKYVKSVERKTGGNQEKRVNLQNQSMVSQSISKLSNSYQLNPVSDFLRKSNIGTLNNSIISAINIYDSMKANGSQESLKFRQKRNLNHSQNNKLPIYQQQFDNQIRTSLQRQPKVSFSNFRGRYQQNPNNYMVSLQPIDLNNSQQNAYMLNESQSLQSHKNYQQQNLLIQQNDSYYEPNDFSARITHMNKSNNKYQTVAHLNTTSNDSRGEITIGEGSSTRRLNFKSNLFQDSAQNLNNSSLELNATTETMMQQKQREMLGQSHEQYQAGKQKLIEKEYKEAIKCFSRALKIYPANKDAKYYRGICQLDNDNPKKCISDLNDLIDQDPHYSQTVYIVLSIAYRRDNDLQNALKSLTKGLQKFPKYLEAYQARGQIYIFMKKFEKALLDFQQVIKLAPQSGAGYIGQAESFKGLGNFNAALQSYNQAVTIDSTIREQGLTKRGALLYQLKNYDQAIKDFQNLLDLNDQNPRAHFYKGKVLKKQGLENEAILHFEQVIKNTTNAQDDQVSGSALFQISKIRIKQKDFYEAFHSLQRAVHYDFKTPKFNQYKLFVEGVLFLMKRKIKKGVKLLSSLIEGTVTFDAKEGLNSSSPITMNQPNIQSSLALESKEDRSNGQLSQSLIYLILTYRAYGYININQVDKAINDLNKAGKIKKLDQASVYNKYIAQALQKIDKKDLIGVRQILNQAELRFPNNKDPYKYQAICHVQDCTNEIVDIDNPKKKKAMLEAKAIIDRALEKNPREPNLLYLRGLILYYCHQFYEALIDLDAVLDLDEEPTAKQYLARGRCHACLSMFQEAIKDLTKALEMDEDLADAYFNRGKCAYLLGDTALAFLDFQKLILLEPKNPMVHIYAGNLLMTTGSYDDATKAFTNADSVQKSALAFYQRSRCHIALGNMEMALKDLCMVVERSPQDKIASVDRDCLQSLKNAISTNEHDMAQVFEKAVVDYTRLLNTSYDIENNREQTTAASRQHQQIIPNVKRIKVEKMRALRRKRAKEQVFALNSKKPKKIRDRFYMKSDQGDEQLALQAETIEPFSYYKENIFGQEDFYLYRGIMQFYLGEYEKAISDIEASLKSKQEQKDLENGEEKDPNADTQSNSSNQTDLSDVGLCSLNVHEAHYNVLLCYLMLKDYKQALDLATKLMRECPKKYLKNLYAIRGLIFIALGNLGKSKQDLDLFKKYDPDSYMELVKSKRSIEINPFPIGSRICSQFPDVKITINHNQDVYSITTKPSFSFPFVKPPNMIPNVEESVLVQEFDLKNVTPPKPEAPWIKRCDFGIKFTDEIQVVDESTALFTDTEQSTHQEVSQHQDRQRKNQDSDSDEDNTNIFDQQQEPKKEETNERYYLRNYVKEQKVKMIKCISEQVMKNDFNFFREMNEDELLKQELEEVSDDDEFDEKDDSDRNLQGELQENLYGSRQEGKRVIVDNEDMDQVEESDYVEESIHNLSLT